LDVKVADSSLGKAIVDTHWPHGVYCTRHTAGWGKSVCSGACLTAWPAIAATSATPKGLGVTAKLGVITRDDGTKQVTVEGLPIYLFEKDTNAGDELGRPSARLVHHRARRQDDHQRSMTDKLPLAGRSRSSMGSGVLAKREDTWLARN
jgi:predicted lipoprotein with Yx(FWY)xxD motif